MALIILKTFPYCVSCIFPRVCWHFSHFFGHFDMVPLPLPLLEVPLAGHCKYDTHLFKQTRIINHPSDIRSKQLKEYITYQLLEPLLLVVQTIWTSGSNLNRILWANMYIGWQWNETFHICFGFEWSVSHDLLCMLTNLF